MEKILIGSRAIKHWFNDFKRKPKDFDYAINIDKNKVNRSGDDVKEYLYNPVLFNWVDANTIPSPDILYTLKLSHMFWDVNWKKHLYDIQFLKEKDCKIIYPLFYDLYKHWKTIHGDNYRSNLNMSAKDFFNNALKCEYDHDYIHTLLKNPPTFTKVLKENAEVDVDENKFHMLSFQEKCDLVQEEVYVMAWERFYNFDYRIAYETMMKKFIMSHAPIWEAIFILDNYKYLYKPNFNFIKQINYEIRKKQN